MKKIIALLLSCTLLFAATVHAQVTTNVTPSKATIAGTDTAYATFSSESTVKSFTAKITKSSGTIGGKVYLQGIADNADWDTLDSLTVGNADAHKTFSPGTLIYKQYRFQYLSNQSGTQALKAYQLRR
jgi:hypothetical protein